MSQVSPVSPKFISAIAGTISLAVLAGFLLIYGKAFYLTWTALGKPPDVPSAFVYVGTALAGLVGAVVAMFFNEQLPDEKPALKPSGNVATDTATPSSSGPHAGAVALRSIVTLGTKNYLAIIATAYCIGYFLAGVAAIITWVGAELTTPEMVKNLALISFGLFIAIARSFVGVSTTP
jgi:hypothetical protein